MAKTSETKPRVLPDLQAQLAAAQAEIARLQANQKAPQTVTIKLSAKTPNVVSVYGLGRFPVSLYAGQWVKLLDQADNIRAIITKNKLSLEKTAS